MRTFGLTLIWCLLAAGAFAQKYGNEWIHYSQQYYKFPVYKSGIYRIDSITLSNYFDLNTINPKNLQLFIKGKEQFLHIKGEADNKINTGDYLEFYSDGTTAEVDSLIYTNINYLPNPYVSLFNDTLYAFISLNTKLNNKRYSIESDTSTSLYPQTNYVYVKKTHTGNFYNPVISYDNGISNPLYTQAEGYGALAYNFPGLAQYNASSSFGNLNVANTTSLNLPSYINYAFSGYRNKNYKDSAHWIRTYYSDLNNNQVLLTDTSFNNCLSIKQSFSLSSAVLGNNSSLTFSPIAIAAPYNRENYFVIHYASLFFPQNLNQNNQSQHLCFVNNHSSASKHWFRFSNFNTGTNGKALFYDLDNGKKIEANVYIPGVVRVVVPNASASKKCLLFNEDSVQYIKKIIKVNGSGYFTKYNVPGLTKPYVIIYNQKLKASATAYQNYRKSFPGGNYEPVFANVEELYEQFSYGVNKHPVAIRKFLNFLFDSLSAKPFYALLIGKGIERTSLNNGVENENLVPSLGIPASDLLYTNGYNDVVNPYHINIPIGRIAALTDKEVNDYLIKVQQYEQAGDAIWKKNILHFTGGDDEGLLNTLSYYMTQLENIAEDTLTGSYVKTFKKNTTAPIQTSINDSVFAAINKGCSILNIFGHGSESNFDQAIDDPNLYNNTGKYSFLLGNSCNSGNIFIPTRRSVSERFILTPLKGSIGFLSTTSFGLDNYLFAYSKEFYRAYSGSQYHRGIGDIIKETFSQSKVYNDVYFNIMAFDMALHGDPALVISPAPNPDYKISNSDLSFDLKKYTDSLGISLVIENTGRAIADSFTVRIKRFYPSGDSAVFLKTLLTTKYRDTLKFYTPIDFNRGFGLNNFSAKVDYYERIDESDENNNATNGLVNVFIPGGDILPVYPYKYAIVPKTSSITLKACTTDPFAPLTTYKFELDTNDAFLKPLQMEYRSSKGGVIEWTVNLPLGDSAVYYWRVSRDSVSAEKSFSWRESSFQTIGTKRGWGQAHFNQFKNDEYQFVTYKKDLRKFVFENSINIILTKNGFFPYIGLANQSYFFNSIKMDDYSCTFNGWNIVVFDSISAKPQAVRSLTYPQSGFGPYGSCIGKYGQTRYQYMYGSISDCGASVWQTGLENLLNSIQPGNYVLAYSTGFNYSSPQYSTYSNSLYQAFESIGSAKIRVAPDSGAMVIFGRKGMAIGKAKERLGKTHSTVITAVDTIKTNWRSGYIVSEPIGPSTKWNSLHWQVKSLDAGSGDTTVLKLVGIRKNGLADTLQEFKQTSTDILDLANYIDAAKYPFLKLVAYMRDTKYTTSPQLKRWQVLYDEAPECAINPLKGFASINDSLQEGDQVTFRFPIENIGVKNFEDSLVVTYWIEDNQRNITPLPQKLKTRPFVPGQIFIDTVTINSLQLLGNNALWLHVNPLPNKYYQWEQAQFNNIGRYPFKVRKDVTNPLLDVTFDGVRILNGDIVSARPSIFVSLKDENKFLALNDTSAFTLSLRAPNQGTAQPLYFAQGLLFTPANLPKNSCSIEYHPVLAVDGRYSLSVQAKDRSANKSGMNNYVIDFEVSNKPTVTGVLNYPNPFSSNTRFVFTLTGSEIPEVFTIQIMTISGKIVREITRSELGYIHIGRNISEYAWDGRDQYGDPLGNGVYLYRIITKLNGENLEKNTSGADKFITREFGKMVLMR